MFRSSLYQRVNAEFALVILFVEIYSTYKRKKMLLSGAVVTVFEISTNEYANRFSSSKLDLNLLLCTCVYVYIF